jgi:hypothetical protein
LIYEFEFEFEEDGDSCEIESNEPKVLIDKFESIELEESLERERDCCCCVL